MMERATGVPSGSLLPEVRTAAVVGPPTVEALAPLPVPGPPALAGLVVVVVEGVVDVVGEEAPPAVVVPGPAWTGPAWCGTA
jgi:hypothetical protein